MPRLRSTRFTFPETGTTVEFLNGKLRAESPTMLLAVVRSNLPVAVPPLPIEIRWPRQGLRILGTRRSSANDELDRMARRLTMSLVTYADGAVGHGDVRSLVLDARSGAVGRIRSDDLSRLRRVVVDAPGYRRLRLAIRIFLLPDELLRWAVRLPRGRSLVHWRLKRTLPFMFILAAYAVDRAEGDAAFGRRLMACIEA